MTKKYFALCLILFFCVCFTGCMGQDKKVSEQVNYSEQTVSAIQTLTSGDTKGFYKLFDENMQKEMSQQELLQLWNAIIKKHGSFEYFLNDVSIRPKDGYQIASVPCVFENSTVTFRLTFNKDGLISGFYVSEDTDTTGLPHLSNDEDVVIGTKEFPLTGCLTLPEGEGPFPAVILVQGHGPSDRNQQTGPNVPFLDIAKQLSDQGIAVLRYDKRSYLYAQELTSATDYTVYDETIDDAALAVDFLKTRNTIDPDQIYIAAHGFSGYLVPRMAESISDVKGYILLAPYARPLEDVLISQSRYILQQDQTLTEEEKTDINDQLTATLKRIKNLTPESNLSPKKLNQLPKGYWLDLHSYDALKAAQSMDIPMLLLQGGRDYQTLPEDFESWKKVLSNKDHFHYRYYKTLNHLFMPGSEEKSPADYEVKGTVSTEVTDTMAEFIQTHTEISDEDKED